MPILHKKQDRSRVNENSRPPQPPLPAPPDDPSRLHPLSTHPIPPRNELVFHCQLAHGSPTKKIKNFSNVKELYLRIGEAFDISPNSIIFCTLNTHKIDMTRLLGGQIGLDDFIFTHVKGNAKTVTLRKQEASIGLTITDNGSGAAFIKRVKAGSLAAEAENVSVGDMIESVDDHNLVGTKHYEVARILKELPRHRTFTMKLIEPMKPFAIAPRATSTKSSRPISQLLEENPGIVEELGKTENKGTLRLKKDGAASIEENLSLRMTKVIERVDDMLESFMGIRDTELAHLMVDLSNGKKTVHDFAAALDNGGLSEFRFPDEFILDVWKVIQKP